MEEITKGGGKGRSRMCLAPAFPLVLHTPERGRARDRGLGRYLGTAAGSPAEERAGRGPSVVANLRRGPRGGGVPAPCALSGLAQLGTWAGHPRLGSRPWAWRSG